MTTYLDQILHRKREELRNQAGDLDLSALHGSLTPCTTDVLSALRRTDRINIIAEHKRRSPSRGPIRPGSNPVEIAKLYEEAGAAAISVLTDKVAFDGKAEDLIEVAKAVSIPVLRKDFIVSPIQVMETRAMGADLVLLIVAALSQVELKSLHALVQRLGMTALVEVHDEHELKVAVDVGAQLIGVNNRNLHTFTVDLETSERLAPLFPPDLVKVGESGVHTTEDLSRLEAAGYDAALVGERLMRAPDPGKALRELRG